MMTKADYQVLAVAMRDGKRELIERGFHDGIAQEVQRIVEVNLVEALAADNPRFNRKLFEQATYPYAEQEGVGG